MERVIAGLCAGFMRPARLARAAIVLKSSTILGFQRALVKRKYQLLFTPKRRAKPGPKEPSPDLIIAIVEMKRRNPRFGCRWIAQQISFVFDVDIDKDIVRRALAKHYRPKPGAGGPSWLSFLGTLDGPAVYRLFNQAIAGTDTLPRYLSSDHDPLFEFHRWKANLRILEVREVKTVPYVPLSHPFVERLIGTIRREYLDHVPFWNARDLGKKLLHFKDYYNRDRVHRGLGGAIPGLRPAKSERKIARLDDYRWRSCCRGLYQRPIAA